MHVFFSIFFAHSQWMASFILRLILRLSVRPATAEVCVNKTHVRHLKEPVFPPLDFSQIEKKFSSGSGPGGSKVSKSSNRCHLKHLPTGIMVASHDTRSLEQNRAIARKKLQQQLDLHFNKDNSYLARLDKKRRIARAQKNKRAVENRAM